MTGALRVVSYLLDCFVIPFLAMTLYEFITASNLDKALYINYTPLMKTNHQAGVDAEEECKKYLQAEGYKIIASRYKTKGGEVDIIAKNSDTVAFVEVKRRKAEIHDDPISTTQKKRISSAALQYISEHPEISELDMRFDCILVDSDSRLTHIQNAWSEI
ncbi:MAG: YraN family protein [Rickettsiales bacterium]